MLEFYEFNTINICISLISIFIIYNLLIKVNKNENENKNENFNIEYLIVAAVFGILISLIIAYFLTEKDEKLLTDNFWDPVTDVV
jgi:hypothetical protein